MISPFTLHQADDLETAVAILSEHGEEAKVLAGGSELILLLKMGLASPKHIVDISRIAELTRLEYDGGAQQLSIGGLVTHPTRFYLATGYSCKCLKGVKISRMVILYMGGESYDG